jgi:hypothetical protein
MIWRSSPTSKDKLFACLTYLVPLIEILAFGGYVFSVVPPLTWLFTPLIPLLPIYYLTIGGIAVVQWGVFIGLYVGVVRNHKLVHFLRYNAIQAILLGILTALLSAVFSLLGMSGQLANGLSGGGFGSGSLLLNTLTSLIFLFVVVSSLFAIVQCIRGRYAEIPVVSEAAYSQVG